MGTFEFNGEKYEQFSKHQKEWGTQLISELLIQGNERILDLGCGNGILTEQLAVSVPNGCVLGIDASMGMIHMAEKHKRDNMKLIQMDINHMEFEDEFDIIFSNAALHWILDHKKLLKNAYKGLKPNGVILWNFAGDGNCAYFHEVIQKTMEAEQFRDYFRQFHWPWYMPSKYEYKSLVDQIGFAEASVVEISADQYFSNAEEMIGWLDQPSLVPFMECVPDEVKKAFRSEVIDGMLQKTRQKDGTYFETFRRIKVRARK